MNKKTALLIIDMQNDFVGEDAIISVKGIKDRLPKFKEFVKECKKKGITVIYTKHIFDPVKNPIEARLFPELAEAGLRENTKGTEIHESLKPVKDDLVIKKRRYDAFLGTDLELVLKTKGIENVIITGTMTQVCCESTTRTAMMKDFNVLFCSDLTFTSNLEVHQATLRTVSTHFGKVLTSEEIFKFF